MIHWSRARSTAAELFDRGFHDAAIERFAAILDQDPTNVWVRVQQLKMLIATGRLQRAERQAPGERLGMAAPRPAAGAHRPPA